MEIFKGQAKFSFYFSRYRLQIAIHKKHPLSLKLVENTPQSTFELLLEEVETPVRSVEHGGDVMTAVAGPANEAFVPTGNKRQAMPFLTQRLKEERQTPKILNKTHY